MAFDPSLLVRSFACRCTHGPHRHPEGRCELCSCAAFSPQLRGTRRYPKLTDFWGRVLAMSLTDEESSDLISGAQDYALACSWGQNMALLGKGQEIPTHLKFRTQVAEQQQEQLRKQHPDSAERSGALLKEIRDGEAARKLWSDRAAKDHARKILSLAATLQEALDEVLESQRLRARFMFAHAPAFEPARAHLRWLTAAVTSHLDSPSQSARQVAFRREALSRMVTATRKKRGALVLIAKAINLASGEKLMPDADTIRSEVREMNSSCQSGSSHPNHARVKPSTKKRVLSTKTA
jgi:hypothetical protein